MAWYRICTLMDMKWPRTRSRKLLNIRFQSSVYQSMSAKEASASTMSSVNHNSFCLYMYAWFIFSSCVLLYSFYTFHSSTTTSILSSWLLGELPVESIPQIVLLTFDDSVNDLNKQLYTDLFEKGRVNPNGCPITATFYVSHEWTDYSQVQNLYSDGHEMASHTVS